MLNRRTPLQRGAPIKRTAFAPGAARPSEFEANRGARLEHRALAAIKSAATTRDAISRQKAKSALDKSARQAIKIVAIASDAAARRAPGQKVAPARSEAYRRAVAGLPCACCGLQGFSQHAHENAGKGKAVKLDDRRAMPLCADRPGARGCHSKFDSYSLLQGGRQAHILQGVKWAAETRARVRELGLWPARLPAWLEDGGGRDSMTPP